MSATATIDTIAPERSAAAEARPGLGRLTLVELRKMTDTRAGFWLLLATALLTVAAAIIACFALPADDRTAVNLLAISSAPAGVLLPVVGILLVSSEWSQRTAMITFALVPQRSRVLVAKFLAGLVLAVVAFALAIPVALAATAVAGADGDATWDLPAAIFGQGAISVAVPMLMGVAFGAALLSSAPAIVLYYVLPTVLGILGEIRALRGTAEWIDTGRTMTELVEVPLSAGQWARVGVSLAVWLVVPLIIGFWRVLRANVG